MDKYSILWTFMTSLKRFNPGHGSGYTYFKYINKKQQICLVSVNVSAELKTGLFTLFSPLAYTPAKPIPEWIIKRVNKDLFITRIF